MAAVQIEPVSVDSFPKTRMFAETAGSRHAEAARDRRCPRNRD
jgi:hypothetical protein